MTDKEIDDTIEQARKDGKVVSLNSGGRVTIDGVPLANSKLVTFWCSGCQSSFQSYLGYQCTRCGKLQ